MSLALCYNDCMEENNSNQGSNTINNNDNLGEEKPIGEEKQMDEQSLVGQKKNHKTKTWMIVGGIIAGIVAVSAIAIGVLAAGGAFNNDSCPSGQHRVCGPLGDGTEACGCYSERTVDLKPIIYLYPEKETDVTVRLGAPEKITSSYPKYEGGWDVTAYPNGDLIDRLNGNKLYSLYWEGERNVSKLDLTTGFVVKSDDVTNFLEEKLNILGLDYREKEEFIVYWLPKLEANKYNYIYFATEKEINAEMPLEFSVQPDTIIRIRMIFKGLDEYQNIEEQKLEPAPERVGFTVVEWGGTEL